MTGAVVVIVVLLIVYHNGQFQSAGPIAAWLAWCLLATVVALFGAFLPMPWHGSLAIGVLVGLMAALALFPTWIASRVLIPLGDQGLALALVRYLGTPRWGATSEAAGWLLLARGVPKSHLPLIEERLAEKVDAPTVLARAVIHVRLEKPLADAWMWTAGALAQDEGKRRLSVWIRSYTAATLLARGDRGALEWMAPPYPAPPPADFPPYPETLPEALALHLAGLQGEPTVDRCTYLLDLWDRMAARYPLPSTVREAVVAQLVDLSDRADLDFRRYAAGPLAVEVREALLDRRYRAFLDAREALQPSSSGGLTPHLGQLAAALWAEDQLARASSAMDEDDLPFRSLNMALHNWAAELYNGDSEAGSLNQELRAEMQKLSHRVFQILGKRHAVRFGEIPADLRNNIEVTKPG